MPDIKPARNYSWPPFEAGNTKAMTHGISQLLQRQEATPAQLAGIEDSLVALLDEFPFLHEADAYELRALARLRYEIDQLASYGDRVRLGEARVVLRGVPKDTPRTGIEAWYASGLASELAKLIEKASSISKNLGLNPSGRWAVAKDLFTAKRLANQKGLADLREIGGRLRRGNGA